MSEQKIEVPVPLAPHPDSMAEDHMTILSVDRSRLICYCPRNQCGAVLAIKQGLWAIYSPLSFKEFCTTLGKRGIELPHGEARETWLNAVTLATPLDGKH